MIKEYFTKIIVTEGREVIVVSEIDYDFELMYCADSFLGYL